MNKELLNAVLMNDKNEFTSKLVNLFTNTTGVLIPKTNRIKDAQFRRLVSQMQYTEPTIYYEENNYSEIILNFKSKNGSDIPMHLEISILPLQHKPIELEGAIFKNSSFVYWINREVTYVMFVLKPCAYQYQNRFTNTCDIKFISQLIRNTSKLSETIR